MPATSLLKRVTCAHCWKPFSPEDSLWIAAHPDLSGDSRLGFDALQRFLPSRFALDGSAIDPKGSLCRELACPHCHLPIPRALLEIEPLFVSILGTPGCGKSYFLTAMSWEMRKVLPEAFKVNCSDVDPVVNRLLNDSEESLFLNPERGRLVPLGDLIRKTELQGELYNTVLYGDQSLTYPHPFMFALRPHESHPNFSVADRLARILCLYDNAGEHFLVGSDSTDAPVTQHLSRSQFLLYLFDPTQDPQFRQRILEANPAATGFSGRMNRQELVLLETGVRIRRTLGLAHASKHNRPLIVVLTKMDLWRSLLPDLDDAPPWIVARDGLAGLDVTRIEKQSRAIQKLLRETCSGFVHAAESICDRVSYVGVSALGTTPESVATTAGTTAAVRPESIHPHHVTVPMLHGLGMTLPGLIPLLKK